MLSHLHIRDFAIIDEVELDFAAGMTVLTGETGAGKSILLDALALVLGDRADTTAIREGAKRAEIGAEFTIASEGEIADWLADQDLDADDQCQLRRIVRADGRSRGFINGRAVPLTLLRELGEQLVDIHGQHEHQSLRHREAQRSLVDAHGGYEQARQAVVDAYQQWRQAQRELANLGGGIGERDERLDLLNYQVEELDALDLQTDEVSDLEAEHRRLANAGQLLEACQSAQALLHDEDISVQNLIARTASRLHEVADYDEGLASAVELIDNARIQIEEATTAVRGAAERVELDPARLEWVEQRFEAIHDLARKHRVEPHELPELCERLRAQRDELANAGERARALEERSQQALAEWRAAAERLSEQRQQAGLSLADAVTREMAELSMAGGRFHVDVQQCDSVNPSPDGLDRVEFRVAPNPGQSPLPLSKVASGGELSRISLAIQMVSTANAGISTQIFDEVDAGIGGRTAAVVGAKLHHLAADRQVLCVTHLPQVAACGHHHYRVAKATADGGATARIESLRGEDRVEEIARMLGGERITEQSRAHAREMVAGEDRAQSLHSG